MHHLDLQSLMIAELEAIACLQKNLDDYVKRWAVAWAQRHIGKESTVSDQVLKE